MQCGAFAVPDEAVQELRSRHPREPNQTWVPEVAKTEGWAAVNRRYLEGERYRSMRAMRDLMKDVGVTAVASTTEAADLLELAVRVFLERDGATVSVTRRVPHELLIRNPECRTFGLMEEQGWHGVTACASWHRRRGWLDALGVRASDSVLAEKKWGDRSCMSRISIESVIPVLARSGPLGYRTAVQ